MDLDELYRNLEGGAVELNVHVQPGAGRTAVVGRHGTAPKVRVAAPPERGRANDTCDALLAETFGAGTVQLAGRAALPAKQFRLADLGTAEFRHRLERAVAEGAGESGPEGRQTGRR